MRIWVLSPSNDSYLSRKRDQLEQVDDGIQEITHSWTQGYVRESVIEKIMGGDYELN